MTGNFKCTSNREEIKAVIIRLGGQVTTGVSGKTNVLLHGYILEDGREVHESRKYKQAMQKNTLIVDEEKFSTELQKVTGKNLSQHLGKNLEMEIENDNEYRKSFFKDF